MNKKNQPIILVKGPIWMAFDYRVKLSNKIGHELTGVPTIKESEIMALKIYD